MWLVSDDEYVKVTGSYLVLRRRKEQDERAENGSQSRR